MTSNAYIASDGETLMKVGKANDPKRREKQITLPMTVTVACLDEVAAYRVESELRNFVIGQGGIRHQSTIDWFKFDGQIYAMLCEFAGKLDGFEVISVREKDIDEEIAELRARYFQLIKDELRRLTAAAKAESERLLQEMKERNNRCREEIHAKSAQIEMLNREVGALSAKFQMLRKQSNDE